MSKLTGLLRERTNYNLILHGHKSTYWFDLLAVLKFVKNIQGEDDVPPCTIAQDFQERYFRLKHMLLSQLKNI